MVIGKLRRRIAALSAGALSCCAALAFQEDEDSIDICREWDLPSRAFREIRRVSMSVDGCMSEDGCERNSQALSFRDHESEDHDPPARRGKQRAILDRFTLSWCWAAVASWAPKSRP